MLMELTSVLLERMIFMLEKIHSHFQITADYCYISAFT